MSKYGDGFTDNDEYLIKEYEVAAKGGEPNFFLTNIGKYNFVVPYSYVKKAIEKDGLNADGSEGALKFRNDLRIGQKHEANKYAKAGAPLEIVKTDKDTFVVPFHKRGKGVKPEDVIDYWGKRAKRVYDTVIRAHKMLKSVGLTKKDVSFQPLKIKQYASFLTNIRGKTRRIAIGTALTLCTLTGVGLVNRCSADKEKSPDVENVQMIENKGVYTDFIGRKHQDTYGNIALYKTIESDVAVLLTFLEGYSEKAFLEGGKTPTAGYGTVWKIDEIGNSTKVTMTDRLPVYEAYTQKLRHCEKNLIPILAEIDHSLTAGEICAMAGESYCWGIDAFRKSKFLQAIKEDAPIETKINTQTGFRVQPGLLFRSYSCANVMIGNWSIDKLMKCPIFWNKEHQAFLSSSAYSLNRPDIIVCQVNSKGEVIKDKKGHAKLVVDENNFGEFKIDEAQSQKNLSRIQKVYGVRGKDYVLLEDILPSDVLNSMGKVSADTKAVPFNADNDDTYHGFAKLLKNFFSAKR